MSLAITIAEFVTFGIAFILITLRVVPKLYKFQDKHATFHVLHPITMEEKTEQYPTYLTKIKGFSKYYLVIVIFTLGSSVFLNSFGLNFQIGASFGANWENPISIILLEAFLLLMFTTIRVIALRKHRYIQNKNKSRELYEQLTGYLFSFLLTTYLLFMYQVGRVIILKDSYTLVLSIDNIRIGTLVFLVSLGMIIPIVGIAELILSLIGVRSTTKISGDI